MQKLLNQLYEELDTNFDVGKDDVSSWQMLIVIKFSNFTFDNV